ncbi:hypothetical protein [Frankia sp. AgKG'84/4]|uniref:hypothetical protein n=1 Tax=Frankia sp. AgKG'84/4 TaxID=573490 RepID=UPI00200FBCCA|nr:hypothetical protein [Frankia sp. AgKG'84/4]MCL9795239.1 hypothetical protein [Frankia sp. AgKG'84/4]
MVEQLAEGLLIAVITPNSGGGFDRAYARATDVGLHVEEVFLVRLDRVVIEMLLREQLSSTTAREAVIPSLLARRVLLSWWHPDKSAPGPRDASAYLATDQEDVHVTLVLPTVKQLIMDSLTGWSPWCSHIKMPS